jgi:hypothetical protein
LGNDESESNKAGEEKMKLGKGENRETKIQIDEGLLTTKGRNDAMVSYSLDLLFNASL